MRLGRLIGGLRFFAGLFFTTSCLAQSVDLPLQLVQSTAGARLIVNIGINGQSPWLVAVSCG